MLSMHPDSVALRKKQQRPKSNYVPPGVDTTRPGTEHVGDKIIIHNTDLWYVVSPQMREKDSIRVFTQYKESQIKKVGKENMRQVDSTVWELWQRKLLKKHRYHIYQPFVYTEKK